MVLYTLSIAFIWWRCWLIQIPYIPLSKRKTGNTLYMWKRAILFFKYDCNILTKWLYVMQFHCVIFFHERHQMSSCCKIRFYYNSKVFCALDCKENMFKLYNALHANTLCNKQGVPFTTLALFARGSSSHSRIFHSYGDVTITGEGLQIRSYICSALMAIEQWGFF